MLSLDPPVLMGQDCPDDREASIRKAFNNCKFCVKFDVKSGFANHMAATHRLDLTGGFRLLRVGGDEIRLSGKKARALLAILALSPGSSASRAKLRGLLWGERGEQRPVA